MGTSASRCGEGRRADGSRMSSSGTSVERSTRSATLPRAQREIPERPCVPIAMRSTFSVEATSRMADAGSPSTDIRRARKPEWRNAQTTLVWMGLVLGTSFLAVSFLAARLHVVPVADESKSVLAIIAQAVYGAGPVGHLLFLILQIGTTLILILAANTSFADFPRLASFHAGDAFMPR